MKLLIKLEQTEENKKYLFNFIKKIKNKSVLQTIFTYYHIF